MTGNKPNCVSSAMATDRQPEANASARRRFFQSLEGDVTGGVPYFPDLSTWYMPRRTPLGAPQRYGAGALIPDADEAFHRTAGYLPMPERFREWTYLDFYRNFNWGVPVHLYDWYTVEYDGAEVDTDTEGCLRTTRYRCPEGSLTSAQTLAEDGSWCPTEHPVKNLHDLQVYRAISERTRYVPRYDRIRATLAEIGEQGVLDLVISRSPFGKLVHNVIGFEELTYMMFDDLAPILEWMAFQEQHDIQLIRLAAAAPDARVVILSDHSDENLISPPHYREYCIPYYRKIADLLHEAGKSLSTHLDGNFKGYMPFLGDTGFDILDGCTPFPMTNWRAHELAAVAARNGQLAWCGVPSTFFCQSVDDSVILDAGREILDTFRAAGARLVLNVGDIVSPTADIHQVIKLGTLVTL